MSGKRVVIAGASGLIGSALAESLRADGVRVVKLVRRPARSPDELEWLTPDAHFGPDALDGADAVIGLNGASIGRLPWTPGYKRTLRDSRLMPTRAIATALRALGAAAPPFLSASAVGYYGDRPGEHLDESSSPGTTYLADLCREWEGEALAALPHSRVALLRTAPLLHREGVLKPLITLTKLGVSGPLGTMGGPGGAQVWPWIGLDDEVRAIRHIIDADLEGPVNLCGPEAATANEIGRELARRLQRPFALPAPAFALRAALGSAATDSLLLSDSDVAPRVLLDSGFEFTHERPEQAIAAALA